MEPSASTSSERGWHVSNLLITVTARSAHAERGVIDRPVVVGRIFPVEPGGGWRGKVCGAGITVTIDARLDGSGIHGDLRVDFDSDGRKALTTGQLSWHARSSS
jgi:hypothetical protein